MGLFDIFSSKPAQQAASDQIDAIKRGYGDLVQNFQAGRQALTDTTNQALTPQQTMFGQGQLGVQQFLDLLGLGKGGTSGIMDTLKSLPGYQFTLDQGTQNVLRNAAATGGPASGATLNALQQQGQGTAQQYYKDYVASLAPLLGMSQTSGNNISNLYQALGQGENTSYTGQGNAGYGANASIGNAQANSDLAAYNASGNLWNVIGGLGGAAAKLAGMGGGGGGGSSNLFGAFK